MAVSLYVLNIFQGNHECCVWGAWLPAADGGVDILRINVRTEETRLINRALTLESSRWPGKPGSADAVQPTVYGQYTCVPNKLI